MARLRELMSAGPQITAEDVERLRTFRPQRKVLWECVVVALVDPEARVAQEANDIKTT